MPCIAYMYILKNNCDNYNKLKNSIELYGNYNYNYSNYSQYTDENDIVNRFVSMVTTSPPPPVTTSPPQPVTTYPPPPVSTYAPQPVSTYPPPPVSTCPINNTVLMDNTDYTNLEDCNCDIEYNDYLNEREKNVKIHQQRIYEKQLYKYIENDIENDMGKEKQLFITKNNTEQEIEEEKYKKIQKDIEKYYYLIVFMLILGFLIWIFALCLLISNINSMHPFAFVLAFLQLFGIPIPVGGPILTIFIVLATSSKYNKHKAVGKNISPCYLKKMNKVKEYNL